MDHEHSLRRHAAGRHPLFHSGINVEPALRDTAIFHGRELWISLKPAPDVEHMHLRFVPRQ